MMTSSNSPCAACKFLRRKCTQGCVFAPYFPADQPQRFANVHRVFGASNVAKLLNELAPVQREDGVNSLAYEADMRLRDPVYGCVGYIFILQHKLRQIQYELEAARKELAAYIGPAAALGLNPFAPATVAVAPFYHQLQQQQQPPHGYLAPAAAAAVVQQPYGAQEMGLGLSAVPTQMLLTNQPQEPQQQQLAVVAAREQEMMRSFEQDLFGGGGGAGNSGLALASLPQSYESNDAFQVHQQQPQQLLQIQYPEHPHPQRAGSEEGRSRVGHGSASS